MAKKTSKAPKGQVKKPSKKTEQISLDNKSPDESSSGPESEDISSDDEVDVHGLEEAQPRKKGTHTVKLTKESENQEAEGALKKKRAIIYVGQLPKLFQERELKKYFSQFGDITRLRLSRNKLTGTSRQYAFVEFNNLEAAQVAAETMNNYLLLGELLKVHVVENPHPQLFAKALKSNFKEFDWRGKLYKQQTAPKPLETWKELQQKYEEAKKAKFEELKELGFDYALEA